MTYTATYANGSAGRLTGGAHYLRASDPAEIAAAINRRLALTYQQPQVPAPTTPSAAALEAMRQSLLNNVLTPPTGTLGGDPPSPGTMHWLWPLADADLGKIIVSGTGTVAPGQVGLLQRICGGAAWTDADLRGTFVRAIHWNQMRAALECVRRGQLRLPVYLAGGLFSILQDVPWPGGMIANNGANELRTCGFAQFHARIAGSDIGLTNIDVLPTSRIEITTDLNCQLGVYQCLQPLDFLADPPTWNQNKPASNANWAQPGGLGSADATQIATVSAAAGTPAVVTGAAVASAFGAIADGAEPNFTIRRIDTGPQTIHVTAELVIDFELKSPPN